MPGDRVTIACVTEGHGEVRALPKLVRRIAREHEIWDPDCPAELGPYLLGRARQARSDIPVSVVLANREFEAWFLAAAYSPTVDQAVLASRFDMKMAQAASPSFGKFRREVELLLGIDQGEQE